MYTHVRYVLYMVHGFRLQDFGIWGYVIVRIEGKRG